ncbi:MAG: preprotein translocase subunit SecA [Alphaproteobacteria bacterium]
MLGPIGKLVGKIFGTRNAKYLKSIQPLVHKINGLESVVQTLGPDGLKAAFAALKTRHAKGESLDSLLPESFALTREAAKRSLGLRPFDVQLLGGIILHQGKIAEMKTGEGKTLMATLAASLNALSGKGVHLVTVNDYLAHRDAEWMRPVYEALGLTVASVVHGQNAATRQAAYQADVTYATNNELGFDYLRDNMAYEPSQLVQRGQPFAIVDEVDSILIDEARTPLIISGPIEDRTEMYIKINALLPNFVNKDDFEVDEKMRQVTLTEAGTDKAEALLRDAGLMQEGESIYDIHHVSLVHHLNNALRAHHMFTRDVQYIVKDDAVILIDEFTGRMTPGRRLSDGLHQAIEAKEGVKIQTENTTLASVTYQNYFRLYAKLAGMTGTAETEAEEFGEIYNLEVIIVPTNVPVSRADVADIVYRKRAFKLQAIVKDIQDCFTRGQPVLVGTTSIEKSEELATLLREAGVPHQVLNARYHEQEADIVSQAGRKGAVTIATNMAGRGTDIKLGGNLDKLLMGVEDAAERDRLTAEHAAEKAEVLAAGGLRVLGTERHESRRIDNQLRGRSGRQGDPGSSVFYLSLQDDLMRIFATNLDALMGRFNMPEHESIQHPWVSKSIETAQRKIEGMHFDSRKHVLKFDNILNEQRKVIYDQRRDILSSEQVDDVVQDFRADVLDALITHHIDPTQPDENWTLDTLSADLVNQFMMQIPLQKWLDEAENDVEKVTARLHEAASITWAEKEKEVTPAVLRRLEKYVLLQVIDRLWRGHLQQLDHLRQGIGLRGYAQKDPINEFSREAFLLFEEMLLNIRTETVTVLARLHVRQEDAASVQAAAEAEMPQQAVPQPTPVADDSQFRNLNINRNAPCPCGSGKKYKHCHGSL